MKIPFNKPTVTDIERNFVSEALESSHHSGDGSFTNRCQTFLEQSLQAPKVLLTTSCTHALEMCAILLDIQPGDEVILPSFTFVSTANAFVLRGATPVFCDIREDTCNIDETILPTLITPKTKAIIVVHYAGVGCEMSAIMDTANAHQIPVIEDNAHGLFSKYRGQMLGTFGSLATQSFHETKNFSCGEGGALVINNPNLIERAEIIREKGTDRSKFFRGQVDKYSWVDVGSSYLPSDLLAAVLLGQLQRSDEILKRRRDIWENYDQHLNAWAERYGIRQPIIPDHCDQCWHMYYLLLRDHEERSRLISHLGDASIRSVFHYLPLHLSKIGRSFGGKPGDLRVTEKISDQLLRLPFYESFEPADQRFVIETLHHAEL